MGYVIPGQELKLEEIYRSLASCPLFDYRAGDVMSKRPAIYARVSTDEDQRPEVQTAALRRFCEEYGWRTPTIYVDTASAADMKGRKAWQELVNDAMAGRFDVLVVWKLDRTFRSVLHAANTLELLRRCGIDFVSYQERVIDTTSPYGEFLFHIFAAFAELERQTIRMRVKAGIEHSRKAGTKSGRPIGRPQKAVSTDDVVMAFRETNSIRAAARTVGCNPGLAYKRLKEAGEI